MNQNRINKPKPKVGFCVVYHPFEENAEKAPFICEKSFSLLKSIENIEVIEAKELIKDLKSSLSTAEYFWENRVDLICVKLATWSSDNLVLEMNSHCNVPFIFWSYSHMHAGSMCGAQQFNMVFKELGKECIFVYRDDQSALDKIINYSYCVYIKNKLRLARFLKIGARTQGMSEVACDEFSVKEVFGSSIYTIGFEDIEHKRLQIGEKHVKGKWSEIKNSIKNISISEEDGLIALRYYLALKDLIGAEQISGITVECYPNHMGKYCLSFSLLADKGIPGACEGDVNALILMFILMHLSRGPVHNIDPLYLYEEDDSIIGSHCGSGSFQLAISLNDIELANVRLANEGTCVLFPSKPGKVTMANLVGRKETYRMGIISGEAIKTELIFPGNPIRVKLPIPIGEYLDIVEAHGLGHHWIIAYGDYNDPLQKLASMLNIDPIVFSS
ncbi:MAG: hypothetical protein GF383_04685 [Candidatus Lokiarchaeota archaeon]|nr:hypothetical protein [Candidatus Lokiarchaeota archaeon]MBD3339092.1 hypothetical protein [Candidatus Lokiarchaeota archaeon]